MLPFHPVINEWFLTNVGSPTDVQKQSWPIIAEGKNILLTAPTGSGKTMASFLWALNQLLTGAWEGEQTRLLYISPLKALNNDIRINLMNPLVELQKAFTAKGIDTPVVRAAVRSGDTTQSERRQMLKKPPEILITTPESLNLLLSSRSGQGILTGIQCVILDEIHSVVDSKRGTHLMTAVDRLVEFSGDFQRVALSATVQPLEIVADFVAGYQKEEGERGITFSPRPIEIVKAKDQRTYDFKVVFPEEAVNRDETESVIDVLAPELKRAVGQNRSTLIFTNSRKMCEKLTLKINAGEEKPIAYSHHGSLSKEIRHEVEQKLKAGELKAIVATHSLELGIDIGFLDEVLLVQSPFSVSSAMQRVGRAGHKVGLVSKATLYPTHAQDFIESAVLSKAIDERSVEPVHPVKAPLDILAQILLSMVVTDPRTTEELYNLIRTSYPYHDLDRKIFDLVLYMLAGRYGDSRIRELKPRISIDTAEQLVSIRKGAQLQLYFSGGTIPDRGYYHIRHVESGARIGELDEEFVWEAHIGKVFTIGAQRWKIEKITHNDVFVRPGSRTGSEIPFWNAEEYGRDFFFSKKILDFLGQLDIAISEKGFEKELQKEYAMDVHSASQLIAYCKRQRKATDVSLPHRKHIVVEHIAKGPGGAPGNQVVIHNFWGARINKPLAMAIDVAWEQIHGQRLEIFGGNDAIALILPHKVDAAELFGLVSSAALEMLLRKRLEGSGFFGARFREAAGRALLVTRNKATERMPLWMTRLKSHKLMDSVLKYSDFPILLETWRSCLQDEFDLAMTHQLLEEIERGEIEISEVFTSSPSPMAAGIAYDQISDYMYRRDKQEGDQTASSLSDELLREVALNEGIRPRISLDIAQQFEEKRQRLLKGYEPNDVDDMVEWVKERRLLPREEWTTLLSLCANHNESEQENRFVRLVILEFTNGSAVVLCRDDLAVVQELLYKNSTYTVRSLKGKAVRLKTSEKEYHGELTAGGLVSELLSFYGPIAPELFASKYQLALQWLTDVCKELLEEQQLVVGALLEGSYSSEVCDMQNYETLLRINRATAAPVVEAKEALELAPFLAQWQGLSKQGSSVEELFERLEQLNGWYGPVTLWEREILPARLAPYDTSWLDAVLAESDIALIGQGKEQVGFSFLDSPELALGPQEKSGYATFEKIFPEAFARYDLLSLAGKSNKTSAELAEKLWQGLWAGCVTNSSFSAIRRGIINKFKSGGEEKKTQSTGRFARRRFIGNKQRHTTLPFEGTWFRLPKVEIDEDLLIQEELKKERVRILFDRYGILFKDLLVRESEPFQWRTIFRTLRLMELSGEIQSGYFFKGISGPQFISHRALHQFTHSETSDTLFWCNGTDPVSLCGINVDELKGSLPRRSDTTHITFLGAKPVLISEKSGRALTINLGSDHDRITEVFAPLQNLLDRRFEPKSSIHIDTINGEPARTSPYLEPLKIVFQVNVEYRGVTLFHKY